VKGAARIDCKSFFFFFFWEAGGVGGRLGQPYVNLIDWQRELEPRRLLVECISFYIIRSGGHLVGYIGNYRLNIQGRKRDRERQKWNQKGGKKTK
jgi:hypothetical protein